ncbi:FkbM family methyltransferase [Hyphococcus luteus]|uniref:Methyltransferase FkbM domain-containing protein n=1 Tax=Hyphococcus luteus TaxID=2058213 RepID=A0A2S7K603_9PROT|nr:FkbM family methyltransferase [Marinicaulis flavus]PQA87906.1 hypothetical protein CW354_06045 [Marinicaulis flavus]
MQSAAINTCLRKTIKNPRIYGYLRRALLAAQFVARSPDEPDFRAFKGLKKSAGGLVVDIGANGGQSAVAFAVHCPGFRILSFEPNPQLWPDLDFIKGMLGARFDFHKIGLADREGMLPLYVPCIGGLPVTTRASLSAAAAAEQAEALARETGQKGSVAEQSVEIGVFDALGLRPDAVKIDVEGRELGVLKGMRETLRESAPVLMVENNPTADACQAFLSDFGYRFFLWDGNERRFHEAPPGSARNWFALPSSRMEDFPVEKGRA